jgi:hypothetical protein
MNALYTLAAIAGWSIAFICVALIIALPFLRCDK